MVRLYRGAVRGRGRPIGRPPFMNRPMRPIRPNGFDQEIPPFARGMGRGLLLRPGPHRPHIPLPPRMGPGPLPHRPPLPPHMAEMRSHPRPLLNLRPGIMPPMLPPRPIIPPGPLLRRPMRSRAGALIGRGRMVQRGVGPKRLGSFANGRMKKSQKRKEKTEEMEVNKPWVTEALKLEIQKKYQLYNIAKEKKNDSDWQIYKDQRILVGKMTNTAKIEYIGSHPEAGEFFCESCDRGWKTQEQLDEHLAEHEVCGRDGCTFTGHPKIILKHVQLQHDSGLYRRIATESPNDVAKWIAERRSRFPTKENIEKNKAQKQEMFDRGERIPKQGKPFQNRETIGSKTSRFQGKSNETNISVRNIKPNRPPPRKNQVSCTENKWRDPEAWKGDLPRFAGTAAFPCTEVVPNSDVKDVVSDEEDLAENKVIKKVTDKPLLSGVLAALVTDYGSDMSDNDAENIVTPESNLSMVQDQRKPDMSTLLHKPDGGLPLTESNELKSMVCVQEENEDESGPEECAVDREDKSGVPILSSERGSPCKLNETEFNGNKLKEPSRAIQQLPKVSPRQPLMQRHQLSLLEKLLKNEIRHERNVILQSVRYVVKNNFFGSGSSIN